MVMNQPKLYGMIWQYLSPESMDEVKNHKEYKTFNDAKDPKGLWKAVVETHKVHSLSKVPVVKKRSARKEYQALRQGGCESLISYRERYDAALKVYQDQGNPALDATYQAMDFFDGLDNGRYAQFKADIHNALTSKMMMDPPKDVNTVYDMAANWVKTQSVQRHGTSTTFVTTVDKTNPRKPNAGKKQEGPKDGKKPSEGGQEEDKQSSKKDKDITCFNCNKKGHYANKCPDRKKAAEESDEEDHLRTLHATWEASVHVTTREVSVHNTVERPKKIADDEILLDNQADISIIRPELVENIKESQDRVRVNGVGGLQLVVDKRGYLPDFYEVYTSEETKANVLSFVEVEDRYRITYVPKEAFIVHLEDRDITFQRRGKLYVAKWEDVRGLYTTVREMESLYTKAVVGRARAVYDLLKNAGYPSLDEFIHLVEDGNVHELPGISRSDIHKAFEIYGLPVEYVRGKMTRKTVSWAKLQEELKAENKDQVLYSDVMVIDLEKFLLTVCEPLQLTLQTRVERETVHVLGTALQGQLSTLRERGFTPTAVHVDPQSAFQGLRTQFPGVVIDVGGAHDFVPKVDAKIRRVKELYRSVKAGLAWSLPVPRVKDLVAYAVSRINLCRTSALHGTLSPRVLFTGCKPSYKKELSLAFGDYVEVHAGTTNTSKERSVPCIALYLCANTSGTWNFWSLSSKQYLRRSVWTKMVTNDLVIRTLNGLAEQEQVEG
jgi:hypothetical protein